MFYYDKQCIVKRYSSTLGQYNRPVNTLTDVGSYGCALMMTKDSNSTTQLEPQKANYTGFSLYMDPESDIRLGDIVCVYDLDEYGQIILSSEYKAVADKPYKKRTHLEIPLNATEEV